MLDDAVGTADTKMRLVWDNLGDAEEGSTSAYSVFNADGQQLPGQLTAQDFEREIMHQMY